MRNLRNDNGYALYVTILLTFFVAVTGISLLTITANAKKTTLNERDDQAFFYYAEAGLNLEKATLTEVFSQIDQEIIDSFEKLATYEDQVALLSGYGNDFATYYYSEINNKFCEKYNELFSPHVTKCLSNRYTGSFELTKQFEEIPVVNTEVELECKNSTCSIKLTGTGFFNSTPSKNRKVVQNIEINAKPYFNSELSFEGSGNSSGGNGSGTGGNTNLNPIKDYTAITNGSIALSGSGTIYGNAGTIRGKITSSGGAKVTGSRVEGLNINNNLTNPLQQFLPEFPDAKISYGSTIPLPSDVEYAASEWNKTMIIKNGGFYSDTWMTKNYTLKLENDTRFNTFKMDQDNVLTIDVGSKEINLFIDDLNIQQGHIKIIGTGKLNIYANKITKVKGTINNNGDPNSLNIYHYGFAQNGLSFSNDTQIFGSFYTKNITLTGGAGFYGNFYSGGNKVEISGGVPSSGQWLVAPNAQLNLLQGGNITGTVLTNTIYMDGGTSISYGEAVVPNPAIPTPPESNPSQAPTSSSDMMLEGPILESDD